MLRSSMRIISETLSLMTDTVVFFRVKMKSTMIWHVQRRAYLNQTPYPTPSPLTSHALPQPTSPRCAGVAPSCPPRKLKDFSQRPRSHHWAIPSHRGRPLGIIFRPNMATRFSALTAARLSEPRHITTLVESNHNSRCRLKISNSLGRAQRHSSARYLAVVAGRAVRTTCRQCKHRRARRTYSLHRRKGPGAKTQVVSNTSIDSITRRSQRKA